jgi:peptide/nickel transport system substrate-binding protein
MLSLSKHRMIAVAAAACMLITGCAKVGDSTTSTESTSAAGGVHSDRLILSAAADPKNLNPALASASPGLELSAFIYSYTIRYDEHSKPFPDAVTEIPTVENGDVSKDGLTLKYKLRHGMKWQDGVGEVQCVDLRTTWQIMINPKNNVNTTEGWNAIKSVDCTDPYVAVVHMKRVYAPFLQQLWSVNGNGPILPDHLLGKLNASGSINEAPYNSLPIGSGPYRVIAWERGNQIRMQANPDFYLGKPKINEVDYKIIPDQNTLATQVKTHELDIGWNFQANAYEGIKATPGVSVYTPTVYQWDHIDFNEMRPMFADANVRRALTYAIDRPTLLQKLRHGLGELSDTFLAPSLYPDAQSKAVVHYGYDVAKAKAILDADGWKVGAGGVRVKNGQRLAFQISTATESTAGQAIQQQVQAYWAAVGASVEVKNYPSSLFFDNSSNGPLTSGKYDVAVYAWSGAADIDSASIFSGNSMPPHGQNYARWNNRRATDAMAAANVTVDQAKRIADYRIVQDEFSKDDPSIIMWFRKFPVSYPSALQGFTVTPVITTPFWDTWDLHY